MTVQHYHPDPDHTPDGPYADEEFQGSPEDNPLWLRENVTLWSVGIDIGSAGTQVLFSRMLLRRQSVDLSSRYLVVERETLFQSPVSLTPYEDDRRIDARALGELVDQAYFDAGLVPGQIDTGVVILTGEALRRENSARIAGILSEKCGDLVCATAGHHMEATLAAHGSGAVHASSNLGLKLLNIDIGGGTTKLSVVERGNILSTAALHIGGRLLATAVDGAIERLDPAGRLHASRAGLNVSIGEVLQSADIAAIAESMADDLVVALTAAIVPDDVGNLYLTDPIDALQDIDAVMFSGGVAEFVYAREDRDFGDLGRHLGQAIRDRVNTGVLPWRLLPDSQGIRSTALGCSEFTAQLSGNTGYISDPANLLPRRNVKVIRPVFDFSEDFDAAALTASIRRHMILFEASNTEHNLVIALHWYGTPRYRRLEALAHGLADALAERIALGMPVYVVLDADIALNLGNILHRLIGDAAGILVIDGIALWDFDSIDIGRLRQPSGTVPVTIKSLVFSDVTGGARRREIVHRETAAADAETMQ